MAADHVVRRLTLAGCALAALCGCEIGDGLSPETEATPDGVSSVVRAPAALDIRTIDPEELVLEVTVDSELRPAERVDDDVWSVSFTVPPNRTVEVTVLWLERLRGVDLPLARAAFPLTVNENDRVIEVSASSYDDSPFDFDSDGASNLQERRADTDPLTAGIEQSDDGDGVPISNDSCPGTFNPDQADSDGDGIGDSCDGDLDGDGRANDVDNCVTEPNADQLDVDSDGVGDACDLRDDRPVDGDGDGVPDSEDNCPRASNGDQSDVDRDGIGDVCDPRDERVLRLNVEARLVLEKRPPSGGSFSRTATFTTEVGVGGTDFTGFEGFVEVDPGDPERQAYLEIAVRRVTRESDGRLRVTLRGLMFIERRELRDGESGRERFAQDEQTRDVTVAPGETSDAELSIVVSDAGATWEGRISVTVRND